MPTVGIIGIGNMGNAILHGILDAGYVKAPNLVLYDPKIEILEKLSREQPSITYCDHALELARISDVIILAVKPNIVASVIDSISPALKEKTVVSIAAGWTCSMLRSNLEPHGASYIRVMPNTPALVGEGMTALCSDYTAPEEVFQFVQGIFDALGRTVILDEKLFDGVIAISGSSPAYVYMLIETMAQGGGAALSLQKKFDEGSLFFLATVNNVFKRFKHLVDKEHLVHHRFLHSVKVDV